MKKNPAQEAGFFLYLFSIFRIRAKIHVEFALHMDF